MVAQTPARKWPTHLDLPDTDGLPVENDYQPEQAQLLTSAILPIFEQLHPNKDFFIGQDVGIYWRTTAQPLEGCKVPDWCYVPGCRPTPPGEYRRSYVMWDEGASPLIVIEFVSGDGSDERDDTPGTGKFWVYRRGINSGYYAIQDPQRKTLEVYRREGVDYRRMSANSAGLFEIAEMGVALGHWRGHYGTHDVTWLRFFGLDGTVLPNAEERAEQEMKRAEQATTELAELHARLRAKGIDPTTI